MRTRLRHLWEIVSSGYWFVPAVMTIAAAALAFGLIYIDRSRTGAQDRLSWLYSGGADGAKTLLSTVAGSVITVAGVVFSITIAALTQASSQFGPRLLRNFMRDTSNQVVLGTFVATFLYCLLVLRTIHGQLEGGVAFVPKASVTAAVLMATASIAVLIYFIHHVSLSLQAPNIVAAVRKESVRLIDQTCREEGLTTEAAAPEQLVVELPADFESGSCPIASTCDGYIQAIDFDGLLAAAVEDGLVLRLTCRPGDYVIEGSALMRVHPAIRCGEALAKRLNAAFICGDHGTAEQDLEYGIRQIVEVAVRALSPGINDPFTAINCIDALASVVCQVARRGLPRPARYDDSGTLRLWMSVSTFAGITDAAFNQIRQYGRDSVSVTIRLLEVMTACGELIVFPDHRNILVHHVESVYSGAAVRDARDQEDVACRYRAAMAALGSTVAPER